ncbi:uncharacterized protein [Prorops nasuta]|uniref:uncharacterized protein n=1 Tax=Prorops nasuta TaxID=863751 RepID=UPI0034CE6FAD
MTVDTPRQSVHHHQRYGIEPIILLSPSFSIINSVNTYQLYTTMARYLLLAFLLICFACLIQGTPLPQESQDEGAKEAAKKIQETLQNAAQSVSKAVEDFLKDPKINEYVESGKTYIQNAAENVRKQFENVVPKTN